MTPHMSRGSFLEWVRHSYAWTDRPHHHAVTRRYKTTQDDFASQTDSQKTRQQVVGANGVREHVVPGVLFNGEQIMTAGEIRRPDIGPISESANQSIHRAWAALGEAAATAGDIAIREQGQDNGHEEHTLADLAAMLAEEPDLSPRVRGAVEGLLNRHRLLAVEVVRQRKLLQEWILSQLTYKALYLQYSGQTPEAPSVELMREKDMVRRRIRDELQSGRDYRSVLDEQSRSPSRP